MSISFEMKSREISFSEMRSWMKCSIIYTSLIWWMNINKNVQVIWMRFVNIWKTQVFRPNESKREKKKRIQNQQTKKHCIFSEPRCGPIGASLSLSMAQCDIDVPQPIIDRRPSVSLFRWAGGSQKRNDAPTPTAARQGLNFINNIQFSPLNNTKQKITHTHNIFYIWF